MSRAEPEHNQDFLSELRQHVNLKVPIMFMDFCKKSSSTYYLKSVLSAVNVSSVR